MYWIKNFRTCSKEDAQKHDAFLGYLLAILVWNIRGQLDILQTLVVVGLNFGVHHM